MYGKKKVTFVISEDVIVKLKLHAILKEQSYSHVVEDILLSHLNHKSK